MYDGYIIYVVSVLNVSSDYQYIISMPDHM